MGKHTKMTFPKNTSKFLEEPSPGKATGGNNQPTGMKSDSQLHAEAKQEDNGKR